jgi:hypothetical protein
MIDFPEIVVSSSFSSASPTRGSVTFFVICRLSVSGVELLAYFMLQLVYSRPHFSPPSSFGGYIKQLTTKKELLTAGTGRLD